MNPEFYYKNLKKIVSRISDIRIMLIYNINEIVNLLIIKNLIQILVNSKKKKLSGKSKDRFEPDSRKTILKILEK